MNLLRYFGLLTLTFASMVMSLGGCAPVTSNPGRITPPTRSGPDPRIGLRAGKFDAAEAIWNLRLLSQTRPANRFVDGVNSDLAFTGKFAIQGSFNGYQVWDISNSAQPVLTTAYYCPASQSDVSVYRNLLFVSGESLTARLDCGGQGVADTVSSIRLRGIRIFDISDIKNPKNVGNVQTCRGSHTHTLLADPKDTANIYIYVSGSAPVRSRNELSGCVNAVPESDSASALFRIEVIKVPLANPRKAAIVSSPRIFNDLLAPAKHPEAPEDIAAAAQALAEARAHGGFIGLKRGVEVALDSEFVTPRLDSIVKARGGTGAATSADTAMLRGALNSILAHQYPMPLKNSAGAVLGPSQCHDITVYPAIGLAGGACGGYGLLLDISNPANPIRIGAAADSNFSFWHSATFNNDGSKILFSDEWGGGTQPKCRVTDRKEWGADAIFTLVNRQMTFRSYYKLPVAQTSVENCVAHNGSLIPIPGRDVMAQAWYQGGISVFDWTDPSHPFEIAFFDRGPVDSTRNILGGSWSVYWYNGVLVSSEIVRGLDILELTPSAYISQNEIDAARTVHFDYLNTQGQPQLEWPPSFALARAYVDQLERSSALAPRDIRDLRVGLTDAEKSAQPGRKAILARLAASTDRLAAMRTEGQKLRLLSTTLLRLGAMPFPRHQ